MMYMFGSAMGCFYRMEWFSLLLFNLLMQKMDVLKNILMAITTNLKMLGMLSLLGKPFLYFRHIIHLDLFYFLHPLLCKLFVPSVHSKTTLLVFNKLYHRTLHSRTDWRRYGFILDRKIHIGYDLHYFYGPIIR